MELRENEGLEKGMGRVKGNGLQPPKPEILATSVHPITDWTPNVGFCVSYTFCFKPLNKLAASSTKLFNVDIRWLTKANSVACSLK
jgi:hypothetical protein